jgi:hypothetical protein
MPTSQNIAEDKSVSEEQLDMIQNFRRALEGEKVETCDGYHKCFN